MRSLWHALLCSLGEHEGRVIATCDLPDAEDETKVCTSCAPLQQCQRCQEVFTYWPPMDFSHLRNWFKRAA